MIFARRDKPRGLRSFLHSTNPVGGLRITEKTERTKNPPQKGAWKCYEQVWPGLDPVMTISSVTPIRPKKWKPARLVAISLCSHLVLIFLQTFGFFFKFGFANVGWLGSQRKKVKRVLHLNNSPVYEMLRRLEVAESRRVGGVVNATRYYHYTFFFLVVVDFLFAKGSIILDNNATVPLLWSRGDLKGKIN